MEIASYRDNPPERQRSDSPSREYSPVTTSLIIPLDRTSIESKPDTEVESGTKLEERPKRVIGDGNIYGYNSTTSYNDHGNHTSLKYADNDDDQEIEAALALALPTSPITDSVPLRAEANATATTRDNNINDRSSLRDDIDPFQTGLGFRHDWEACAACVMLPPVGSVALLLLEQRNDYVRYVLHPVLIVLVPYGKSCICRNDLLLTILYFVDFTPGSLVCCLQ